MTALAPTADSLWTPRGLYVPTYPQAPAFSLRELLGRVIPLPRVRVLWETETATMPTWASEVVAQLLDHLALPTNWDSYGGRALTRENFQAALRLLGQVMTWDSATPWVVPLPSGGVQLEWHGPGLDIEIAVDRDDSFVLISVQDEERELSIGESIAELRARIPSAA